MSADGFSFAAAPSPADMAGFDFNDYGNGLRLIRTIGGVIRPDGEIDIARATLLYQIGLGWVGYNGRFWDQKFGEQLARRAAHKVSVIMRSPAIKAAMVERGLSGKEAIKYLDSTGNRGGTSAMLVQAEPYLTVELDAFDRDPMTLNVRNGTLALSGAGGQFAVTVRPHDPADRITRFIDVDFDPDAAAPLFRKVVEESLPDDEQRAFLKRALGYATTGAVHEQAWFICQGLGRDGKSTILDACRSTLGGYGAVGNVATFLDTGQRSGGDAAPDLVKLSGDRRLAVLSEPPRGVKLNEGLLKAWTSGSPITARELREKPFDFRPVAKLFMECNALPPARGDDDGTWRRVNVIMFEHQVPEAKQDKLIPRKLEAERPGILNWLLEGVGEWLGRGLDPPARVKKALEDYRKMSSPFGDWLTERCVWGAAAEGRRTLASELHGNYVEWAEGQGHDKPMSQRAFGDALHQRQILVMGKDPSGKKYRGPIRLKTLAEMAEDRAREEGPPGAGGGSGGYAPPPEDGPWGGE